MTYAKYKQYYNAGIYVPLGGKDFYNGKEF
jgi:hypothetical protein